MEGIGALTGELFLLLKQLSWALFLLSHTFTSVKGTNAVRHLQAASG